jgi:serine/threonine protein kinase
LGEGAFGKVFLAKQVSLARQVALKITANLGSEARTMASLEHDNIVQVFSEVVVPEMDARLLCMQYVPGTTLGKVIRQFAAQPSLGKVSGQRVLQVVDDLSAVPAEFQAAGFQERTMLAESDQIETVTLLGSRLAGALNYAHKRGVLHRDIKPDNILISQYGRPLLVDFNLSLDPHQVAGTHAGMFGGSLRYMAPEHLDALNLLHPTPQEAVDQRSDIFSLGVVLYELLHLRRPFREPTPGGNQVEVLEEMADHRRDPRGLPSEHRQAASEVLEGVVRRCLLPDPKDRFQSANELRLALDSARQLHGIRKALPKPDRLMSVALRRPLLMLILAVLVPNLLGSILNISYNTLRIVSNLTEMQMTVFQQLIVGYNLIVYPICIFLLMWQVIPIFFQRRPDDPARIRRRIVTLPVWVVVLCVVGWLPGGVVFPLVLQFAAGPLAPTIFGHFVIDFAISGLVAVTYSYFGAEAILLRVLYPRFLAGEPRPHESAREELRGVSSRIYVAQTFAGVIPLIGATLLVVIGPAEVGSYGMFRVLVVFLIALGMVGFGLSLSVAGMLQQTTLALTRFSKN